jgi:hypothetical protein
MSEFILAIGSLIIGVLATLLVSRYYFKRTVDKSLTPYLQFFSSFFAGVDPSLRESLKIEYKGIPVTELLEMQFLIANTGERPIRDMLTPLSLTIPKGCSLLDASILHIEPEGREVKIEKTDSGVLFLFPLLNSREFFITKLLLQGQPKPLKDWIFRISVDDIPPSMTPINLPPDLIETGEKREFEQALLWIGLILVVLGSAFAGLIFTDWPVIATCWKQGIISSFRQNWIVLTSSVITAIPALLLLVLGPMMMVGAFTNFSFPRRRRFSVPSGYGHRSFHSRSFHPEFEIEMERKMQANKIR